MTPEHPSKYARIGAVLTLIGSLIWVQWPIDFERFNAAALVLVVGSFAAWISMELAEKQAIGASQEAISKNENILIEDVNKVNSIIKLIDRNQYYTIKNTLIQTYMDRDAYRGLSDLNYFRTNDIFPFHSSKLQEAYTEFADNSEKFLGDFFNLYTSDGRGSMTWKPRGDEWVEDEIFDKIMGKIAKLNKQASALATEWENFIVLAQQELRGASKSIDRYDA